MKLVAIRLFLIPHADLRHSPNKTPGELTEKIIKLKAKYKRLGAEQIKVLENLTTSAKTMRKIWRQNNISTRQRRKKHITKQNLRELKKAIRSV